MNKVILSGNLCQDIEKKQTNGGESWLRNCIAIKRDFKNPNGDYETDFIQIVVWRQQADYLAKNARKGDMIELVGRWQTRKIQDQQENTREVSECVVENLKILQNRVKQKEEPVEMDDEETGELPF